MEKPIRFSCPKLCLLAALCSVISFVVATESGKYPFFPHSATDELRIRKLVENINAANISWEAEYNPRASLEGPYTGTPPDLGSLKLDGLDLDSSVAQQIVGDTEEHLTTLAKADMTLPESFDARDKWPRCVSISNIQNQGGCGSCWAAASVSVMSDRLCISTEGKQQQMISLQDLVSCCDYCGKCTGCWIPTLPFHYWKNNGIVTGGSFGSSEGCRPYEVEATCGSPCPTHFYNIAYNQQCNKTCDKMHGKSYERRSFYWIRANKLRAIKTEYFDTQVHARVFSEISRVKEVYSVSSNDLIKRDIMTNGPVAFCVYVAEPFAHYRSGVFTSAFEDHAHENLRYGHCMRMIGWGIENGEEYWTIANSWGRQWGENGFGKLSMQYHAEYMDVVAPILDQSGTDKAWMKSRCFMIAPLILITILILIAMTYFLPLLM